MAHVVISSGHGLKVRGASGIIDEVDEARLVVECVADRLNVLGIKAIEFHDNESTTVDQNLDAIVSFHNSQQRELDVSVHFNDFEPTDEPVGTEVLYVSQEGLAEKMSAAIADAGHLIDRGPKFRDGLYFLNNTDKPSILIEVCFVNSSADCENYSMQFGEITEAIAQVLADHLRGELPAPAATITVLRGKCSFFGGPDDTGVSPSEGLAFIYEYEMAPELFLPQQPPGTTGLARRLDPEVYYIACRWDYDQTSKTELLDMLALVRAPKTGRQAAAHPADWGPNENTGRVADLSKGLMDALGIETDDEVEVAFFGGGDR